ncbi:MAG: S8 family peptidase [Lachnospiraceae bacterium]|nr:S8 family peptidase [Lachnospiraceae bacterium]
MDCRTQILSNDYFDVITDFSLQADVKEPCAAIIENQFRIFYYDRSIVGNTNEYFFQFRNVPKLYGLMQEGGMLAGGFDPNSLIASGITQIQREPLALTGRGVIICVIDTGIDYTNPAFRNPDGTSRILAIWDQTIQEGSPPEGFQYGTEYTKEAIDRALEAEDAYSVVPSRDENGHGSMMAGVAAGSRVSGGLTYQGAAPDADIVVVRLKECKQYLRDFYMVPEKVPAYQENDIMLAVQYADGFAVPFQKPVVICLGLGTSYGDHAGTAPLARYLDLVAVKRSRAVVLPGGNEGNALHHYQGRLGDRNGDSISVEVRVEAGNDGFIMELWGSIPDAYTVSVRSPGGETIPRIRLGVRESITYSFVYERTRVTIAGTLADPVSGEELILLRLQDPTPGIWTFQVSAVGDIHNGVFHVWLPISQFLSAPAYFLEPSPYVTMTDPSFAKNAISVSTYDSDNNSFYINSGRGFSRTGDIKPDLAAPGVNVSTIRGKASGSSLAAAITAGAAAQFLQWAVAEENNIVVESRGIKNYLIRGASRSFDISYPSREWGYGRLNMVGTFDALIGV